MVREVVGVGEVFLIERLNQGRLLFLEAMWFSVFLCCNPVLHSTLRRGSNNTTKTNILQKDLILEQPPFGLARRTSPVPSSSMGPEQLIYSTYIYILLPPPCSDHSPLQPSHSSSLSSSLRLRIPVSNNQHSCQSTRAWPKEPPPTPSTDHYLSSTSLNYFAPCLYALPTDARTYQPTRPLPAACDTTSTRPTIRLVSRPCHRTTLD